MSPVSRLLRYASALLSVNSLKQRTERLLQAGAISEMISETFRFERGFLEPIQVEQEINRLVEDVRSLRPRAVLEIGTSMGGTLFLWCRVAAPDAKIISVDLPGGPCGGGYSPLRIPVYRRFANPGQNLHLVRADSHSPQTHAKVRRLLNGQKVDFLFIDGDHSYNGVKRDWETYRQMVRTGGLVAFHDIVTCYKGTEVKRLWDEIRSDYETREYAYHPRKFYGIGVAVMP